MRSGYRVVAVVAAAHLLSAATAEAVTIRVRGTSRIEARAVPRPDGIEVLGRLIDDAGRPIDGSAVKVDLDYGERNVTPLPPARSCPGLPPPVTRAEEYIASTNAEGRFCLRVPRGDLARRVRLRFKGDRYHDASAVKEVTVDPSRPAAELEFFPEPRYLALDRAVHDIWVRARLRSGAMQDEPLHLQLLFSEPDGEPALIESGVARPGERIRFAVPSKKLGGPGPGVFTIRCSGSSSVQPTSHDVVVETTARVDVSLAARGAGGDPNLGIEIPVAVGSLRGAVPSGVVEALVGGRSVGSAPVSDGAARITARFDGGRADRVDVTLRYVPSAPWWVAGEPLVTTVELARPSPWRRWPWALAALFVALWVTRSWARPKRTERDRHEPANEPPLGKAEVVFIEPGPERSGWRGVVVDAHDGQPIQSARVRVLSPSFAGSGIAATAVTNEEGRFRIDHVETAPEGSQLEVSATWHATLTRDLPPSGSVAVSLVTRRRALLDSLVRWARRLGRPWAGRREPTPGQVARVAAARRSTDIREWAEAVERAAFGPEAVDEARETAIRARQPRSFPDEHT